MTKALKDAVQRIKDAGFDHIKVELEGQIGRDGERECTECEGQGQQDCFDCDGEGVISEGYRTRISDQEIYSECNSCMGDGVTDCEVCDGTGNRGDYYSEETCENYMREWVSQGARDRLVYGNFYDDGSVDSEFTFTVHIDHLADVMEWIDAFKSLASHAGDGEIDTRGAGMHVSVLPSSANGHYPCTEEGLPSDKVDNFMNEVTKLLPALFFMASPDHRSRALNYRHGEITHDKYGAISTHYSSCFEFRVFETCYNKPEAFFDYIEVIANCLKYYADPTAKVKKLGKQFAFMNGNGCARFFDTAENLRILNATIKEIKPKDKSFKKLREERGMKHTIKSLSIEEKKRASQLRGDYLEYKERMKQTRTAPLRAHERAEVDILVAHEGYTMNNAIKAVRRLPDRIMSLREFVKENMQRQRGYDYMVNV